MLVLNRDDVEKLLDLDDLVDALADAMRDLSSGKASAPSRIGAVVREHDGVLGAMPGFVPSSGVLCTKLVTLFPHNRSLPTHQAVIVVFDPENGQPIALMDGTAITAVRTAAGSALATKLLARKDARVLAILGTGVQAWSHVRAIPRVRAINEIRIAGRNFAKASSLAEQAGKELGIAAKASPSWKEAIDGADIVCATTHPHEPVVRGEWLHAGVHVNSVGMSTEGHEVDIDAFKVARVFVEQRSAAAAPMPTGSNDLRCAVESGAVALDSIAEIGEVILGQRVGRQSDGEITIYKSVGVAVQDAAAAGLVLEQARAKKVGAHVEL